MLMSNIDIIMMYNLCDNFEIENHLPYNDEGNGKFAYILRRKVLYPV